MKAPLLLAALLLVAPAAASQHDSSGVSTSTSSVAGSDDPYMQGYTKRMFIINASIPGALTFSGAGTAQFNNSVGTSNQFNVGSTTSIGVEANVSATQEFDALASGLMQMGAGSNLMQTNGTSTAAASIQAAAVAANSVAIKEAESIAHAKGFEEATIKLYGVDEESELFGNTYTERTGGMGSDFFGKEDTGDYGTINTAGNFEFNDAKYSRDFSDLTDGEKQQLILDCYDVGNCSNLTDKQFQQIYDLEDSVWRGDKTYSQIAPQVTEIESQISELELEGAEKVWSSVKDDFQMFKNVYNTEKNSAYNQAYENSFNNVITKSSLNITESTETGMIKGVFNTTSDITTAVGAGETLNNIASSALTAANATGDSVGGTAWNAAFAQAYEAGYQSSIGVNKGTTSSDVTVEGLGAIASVNTDTKSNFAVNLDRLAEFKASKSQDNSSATATGGATSTLSTNSFATQSSARTASAFMQAFAANDQ